MDHEFNQKGHKVPPYLSRGYSRSLRPLKVRMSPSYSPSLHRAAPIVDRSWKPKGVEERVRASLNRYWVSPNKSILERDLLRAVATTEAIVFCGRLDLNGLTNRSEWLG